MSMSMTQPPYTYEVTFRASTNADEDWTKISDFVERRRIQNRIAQRNYRKKLKRRLEDLERRACSSDDAESDKQPQKPTESVISQGQLTSQVENPDGLSFTGAYDDIDRSNSPPHFTYHPSPDDVHLTPYDSASLYPATTTANAYANYMTASTVPTPPPSAIQLSDGINLQSDEGLTPYMTYSHMSPMDFNTDGLYEQFNPYTPLLSYSFHYPANCLDAGFGFPATPDSSSLNQPQ